jgi:hypothetical protein
MQSVPGCKGAAFSIWSKQGGFMKKSVSRTFFLLALLFDIVGVGVFIFGASGGNMNTLNALAASGHLFVSADMSNSHLTAIGALLVTFSFLFLLIAWIGALIKTARLGRWGWFICLIIFSALALLIYVFFGPTTSTRPTLSNASYPNRS